jgi:hypothetical protein
MVIERRQASGLISPSVALGYVLPVVRGVLAAALLLGIAVALWIRLPVSTLDQLLADLRAERVSDFQFGPDDDFGVPLIDPRSGGGAHDIRVRWRTVDGSWHTFLTREQGQYRSGTNSAPGGQPTASPGPDERSTDRPKTELLGGQDPVLNLIAAELQPEVWRASPPANDWNIGWISAAVFLACAAIFISLVAGPQPRRATRWAWFWLLGLPYGLGFVALLAFEAPWSKRACAQPEPLPHDRQRNLPEGDRRLTGVAAFLIARVVAPLVLSLAVTPLLRWLGIYLPS